MVILFFCGGRGLNPGHCIYYALSIPTELSSRGQTMVICNIPSSVILKISFIRRCKNNFHRLLDIEKMKWRSN